MAKKSMIIKANKPKNSKYVNIQDVHVVEDLMQL